MVVVLLLLLLMVALFTFLFSYDFCFYLYFLFLSVRFIFSAGFRCICLNRLPLLLGLLAEGRGMCGEEAKQNPQMDIKYNVQFRREESCMGISCEIVSHFLRSGEEFY